MSSAEPNAPARRIALPLTGAGRGSQAGFVGCASWMVTVTGFDHILNWKLHYGSHPFPGKDGGACINEAAIVAAGFEYQPVRKFKDMLGAGSDVDMGEGVVAKCEAEFVSKLSRGRLGEYRRAQSRCSRKYRHESGTMYPSLEAHCAAEVARSHAGRLPKSPPPIKSQRDEMLASI